MWLIGGIIKILRPILEKKENQNQLFQIIDGLSKAQKSGDLLLQEGPKKMKKKKKHLL